MRAPRGRWGRSTLVSAGVLAILAVAGGIRQSRAEPLAGPVVPGPDVTAAAAPPFFDIFMDIAGIAGESTNAQHAGSIDVTSWSWDVAQTAAGSSGAGVVSREKTGHVTLIKRIDKASPPLFKRWVDGTVLPLVTVQLTQADGQTLMKYELKNVMVGSITHGGDLNGDGLPDETLELTFGGVKLTYTQFDTDGTPLGQTAAEW